MQPLMILAIVRLMLIAILMMGFTKQEYINLDWANKIYTSCKRSLIDIFDVIQNHVTY